MAPYRAASCLVCLQKFSARLALQMAQQAHEFCWKQAPIPWDLLMVTLWMAPFLRVLTLRQTIHAMSLLVPRFKAGSTAQTRVLPHPRRIRAVKLARIPRQMPRPFDHLRRGVRDAQYGGIRRLVPLHLAASSTSAIEGVFVCGRSITSVFRMTVNHCVLESSRCNQCDRGRHIRTPEQLSLQLEALVKRQRVEP